MDLLESSNYSFVDVRKIKGDDNNRAKGIILGKGASSTIFLARDIVAKRKHFAIKELNKLQLRRNNVAFEAVKREAELHSELIHRNIVRLYSFTDNINNFKFLLSYEENGSLYKYVNSKQCRALPEAEAAHIFIGVLGAVCYLHINSIAHRDLRLKNVLLDKMLNPKITGFSRAVRVESIFRNSSSPQNYKIDVWSLGIFLYQMVSGTEEQIDYLLMEEVYKAHSKNVSVEFCNKTSSPCKDLITCLLKENIYNGKATRIYGHPWIIQYGGKCDVNSIRSIKDSVDSSQSSLFLLSSNKSNLSINRVGSITPSEYDTSNLNIIPKMKLLNALNINQLNSECLESKTNLLNSPKNINFAEGYDVSQVTRSEITVLEKVMNKIASQSSIFSPKPDLSSNSINDLKVKKAQAFSNETKFNNNFDVKESDIGFKRIFAPVIPSSRFEVEEKSVTPCELTQDASSNSFNLIKLKEKHILREPKYHSRGRLEMSNGFSDNKVSTYPRNSNLKTSKSSNKITQKDTTHNNQLSIATSRRNKSTNEKKEVNFAHRILKYEGSIIILEEAATNILLCKPTISKSIWERICKALSDCSKNETKEAQKTENQSELLEIKDQHIPIESKEPSS